MRAGVRQAGDFLQSLRLRTLRRGRELDPFPSLPRLPSPAEGEEAGAEVEEDVEVDAEEEESQAGDDKHPAPWAEDERREEARCEEEEEEEEEEEDVTLIASPRSVHFLQSPVHLS